MPGNTPIVNIPAFGGFPSSTQEVDVSVVTDSFIDIVILVYFPGTNLVEVPWDGSVFTPLYVAASTSTPFTPEGEGEGHTFILARAGGWPAIPVFKVHAVSSHGQENV